MNSSFSFLNHYNKDVASLAQNNHSLQHPSQTLDYQFIGAIWFWSSRLLSAHVRRGKIPAAEGVHHKYF
jgi:hypothetical protein